MVRIGIIGGAGPRGGALLFKKIIDEYVKRGSWQDHEFPFIALLNVPFMPMMEDNINSVQIRNQLQEAIDYLYAMGITDFTIACNTLGGHLAGLDYKGMKFHSLIESALKAIETLDFKKVIIAATRATKSNNLYNDARCEYTNAEISDKISEYIHLVLQQKDNKEIAQDFYKLIMSFDFPVILGCTELSVLNADYNLFHDKKIIDPLDCVLKNLLETY